MKILKHQINVKENLSHSLRRYRVWWAILVVTIIFDYLTTLNFVGETGIRAEANLLIAWWMKHLGIHAGLAAAKMLQLVSVIAVVCLSRRLGNLFLLVVILLNCWAVVMNVLPQYPLAW